GVKIFALFRAVVLEAGDELARRGQLASAADVWHLGFDELQATLDDPKRDVSAAVAERKAKLDRDRLLKPPLGITSDGEILQPGFRGGELPKGALPGTPAS